MGSGTKFLFSAILFFSFMWLFFHLLLPFLFPFLLGLGLSLAAEPLTRFFAGRLHGSRGFSACLAVFCTFILFTVFLGLLLTLLFQAASGLTGILPDLSQTVVSGISLLEQQLLALSSRAPQSLRGFLSRRVLAFFTDSTAFLQQGAGYVLGIAGGALSQIPGQAFTLFTAVVSGFMISVRLPAIREFIRDHLSGKWIGTALDFLKKLRLTLGHWLLAQLKLAGVTLIILTLGFVLLKIPYAPIWALLIALMDALPVLGTGVALIPWSIVSFLRSDPVLGAGLLAVYVSAALTRSLLEPRFVGKQLGLDPLITLAAIYAGYRLWGFGGMILSPMLAVTVFRLIPEALDSRKSA